MLPAGSAASIPTHECGGLSPRFGKEEGKLDGLPRNEQATALVAFPSPREMMETLRTNPDIIFVGEITDTEVDYIAGDVLVCESSELK